jgi:hypothetical protein
MTVSSSSSESSPPVDALSGTLGGVREASAECLLSPAALTASSASIDELLHVAVRLTAARLSTSAGPQITDLETPLTATEAALVCTRLLAEVDLDLFELAMWRNWGKA